MMIKVVHLSYSDNYGGASVAMNRINESLLLNENIDSKIAVVVPSEYPNVLCLSFTLFEKVWLYIRTRVAYKMVNFLQRSANKTGRSINFFPSTVYKRLNKLEFDILHLHWIGNETISFEDLAKIKKPIVWTFHDKWPLLGAEHTEITESKRFVEGYSKQNKPKSTKGIDIDRWTWNRKRKALNGIRIQPVAVSSWLASEIKKSFLWKNSKSVIIHNPINIDSWKIKDKKQCRDIFNIDVNDKVLVFGAVNAFGDELKGYHKLEQAICIVGQKLINEKITLLVFGDPDVKEIYISKNVILKSVGKVNDNRVLNQIYGCADLVAVPSYVETFGQVAVEAMACGIPVVAFKTSGLIDIVIENFNGLLCEAFEVADMAEKIIVAFSTKWNAEAMRKNIDERFGYNQISKNYELFYHNIINNEFI